MEIPKETLELAKYKIGDKVFVIEYVDLEDRADTKVVDAEVCDIYIQAFKRDDKEELVVRYGFKRQNEEGEWLKANGEVDEKSVFETKKLAKGFEITLQREKAINLTKKYKLCKEFIEKHEEKFTEDEINEYLKEIDNDKSTK